MTVRIAPPPINTEDKAVWNTWYLRVKDAINQLGLSFLWTNITFTGSNITDVVTRNHNDLQNMQGGTAGQYYHITSTQSSAISAFNATQWTDLTDGGGTTLHTHTHNSSTSVQGGAAGDYYHLTAVQHADLTDGGTTTLHTHTLHAVATLNFGSIAANSTSELTMTVAGATTNAAVYLGAPPAIEAGLIWCGYVSAADTVSVRIHNMTGGAIDPASADWHVRVEVH